MIKNFVNRLATTLLGATVFATPIFAQQSKPTVARLTPYVGYIQFGHFMDGPIGTRISNREPPSSAASWVSTSRLTCQS